LYWRAIVEQLWRNNYFEPKNRSLPYSGVHCNLAEQQLNRQSRSWRGVNALDVRPKAQNFGIKFLGIEYTFERLTRSGRRHPKVRILIAVRHLSSPGVVNQQNLTPSELISLLQLHVKKPIDTTSMTHDCLLFG